MHLSQKTLEKLRCLINEETEYRSGPRLVQFFNELGFRDEYGQGFPARWYYTDDKLNQINGTTELADCIRKVLAPINFIGRLNDLDRLIGDFNQYLVFDKWRAYRSQAEIILEELEKIEIDGPTTSEIPTAAFLSRELSPENLTRLGLDSEFIEVINDRISEIENCSTSGSPLAVVLLAGSTLEGILLGLATRYPQKFNTTNASPKDRSGKVKHFHEWRLSELIDVAAELRLIQHDTQQFSQSLRDFRNYIHPLEQLKSGFNPRDHTADICLQVLRAAITELGENVHKLLT